jgi:hypothetical protein
MNAFWEELFTIKYHSKVLNKNFAIHFLQNEPKIDTFE